jgi:CheY-like chemotaxis protein
VVLAVSDEGMGIDADARAHIFEPFFTTKAPGAGSGLGLASVHRIAQQAGGHVALDSEPGFGTTFRVYLPWAGARPLTMTSVPAAPAPSGRETVLVAEGSQPVREVTRELLEGLGYTVLVAANAEEALRLARERQEPIDVVLADAAMPGLRGGRLDEQLVAARPRTRVLLMAADAESGVAKPFTEDRLARAIRDALDAGRG